MDIFSKLLYTITEDDPSTSLLMRALCTGSTFYSSDDDPLRHDLQTGAKLRSDRLNTLFFDLRYVIEDLERLSTGKWKPVQTTVEDEENLQVYVSVTVSTYEFLKAAVNALPLPPPSSVIDIDDLPYEVSFHNVFQYVDDISDLHAKMVQTLAEGSLYSSISMSKEIGAKKSGSTSAAFTTAYTRHNAVAYFPIKSALDEVKLAFRQDVHESIQSVLSCLYALYDGMVTAIRAPYFSGRDITGSVLFQVVCQRADRYVFSKPDDKQLFDTLYSMCYALEPAEIDGRVFNSMSLPVEYRDEYSLPGVDVVQRLITVPKRRVRSGLRHLYSAHNSLWLDWNKMCKDADDFIDSLDLSDLFTLPDYDGEHADYAPVTDARVLHNVSKLVPVQTVEFTVSRRSFDVPLLRYDTVHPAVETSSDVQLPPGVVIDDTNRAYVYLLQAVDTAVRAKASQVFTVFSSMRHAHDADEFNIHMRDYVAFLLILRKLISRYLSEKKYAEMSQTERGIQLQEQDRNARALGAYNFESTDGERSMATGPLVNAILKSFYRTSYKYASSFPLSSRFIRTQNELTILLSELLASLRRKPSDADRLQLSALSCAMRLSRSERDLRPLDPYMRYVAALHSNPGRAVEIGNDEKLSDFLFDARREGGVRKRPLIPPYYRYIMIEHFKLLDEFTSDEFAIAFYTRHGQMLRVKLLQFLYADLQKGIESSAILAIYSDVRDRQQELDRMNRLLSVLTDPSAYIDADGDVQTDDEDANTAEQVRSRIRCWKELFSEDGALWTAWMSDFKKWRNKKNDQFAAFVMMKSQLVTYPQPLLIGDWLLGSHNSQLTHSHVFGELRVADPQHDTLFTARNSSALSMWKVMADSSSELVPDYVLNVVDPATDKRRIVKEYERIYGLVYKTAFQEYTSAVVAYEYTMSDCDDVMSSLDLVAAYLHRCRIRPPLLHMSHCQRALVASLIPDSFGVQDQFVSSFQDGLKLLNLFTQTLTQFKPEKRKLVPLSESSSYARLSELDARISKHFTGACGVVATLFRQFQIRSACWNVIADAAARGLQVSLLNLVPALERVVDATLSSPMIYYSFRTDPEIYTKLSLKPLIVPEEKRVSFPLALSPYVTFTDVVRYSVVSFRQFNPMTQYLVYVNDSFVDSITSTPYYQFALNRAVAVRSLFIDILTRPLSTSLFVDVRPFLGKPMETRPVSETREKTWSSRKAVLAAKTELSSSERAELNRIESYLSQLIGRSPVLGTFRPEARLTFLGDENRRKLAVLTRIHTAASTGSNSNSDVKAARIGLFNTMNTAYVSVLKHQMRQARQAGEMKQVAELQAGLDSYHSIADINSVFEALGLRHVRFDPERVERISSMSRVPEFARELWQELQQLAQPPINNDPEYHHWAEFSRRWRLVALDYRDRLEFQCFQDPLFFRRLVRDFLTAASSQQTIARVAFAKELLAEVTSRLSVVIQDESDTDEADLQQLIDDGVATQPEVNDEQSQFIRNHRVSPSLSRSPSPVRDKRVVDAVDFMDAPALKPDAVVPRKGFMREPEPSLAGRRRRRDDRLPPPPALPRVYGRPFGDPESAFELGDSTIHNSGFGLFSTRLIAKNEAITWYDGTLVTAEEVARMDNPSHVRSVNFHEAIDGINANEPSRGAASLVQHASSAFVNAKFVLVHRNDTREYIVLKAIHPIPPGREIFVDYGRAYWARLDMEPIDPPPLRLAAVQGLDREAVRREIDALQMEPPKPPSPPPPVDAVEQQPEQPHPDEYNEGNDDRPDNNVGIDPPDFSQYVDNALTNESEDNHFPVAIYDALRASILAGYFSSSVPLTPVLYESAMDSILAQFDSAIQLGSSQAKAAYNIARGAYASLGQPSFGGSVAEDGTTAEEDANSDSSYVSVKIYRCFERFILLRQARNMQLDGLGADTVFDYLLQVRHVNSIQSHASQEATCYMPVPYTLDSTMLTTLDAIRAFQSTMRGCIFMLTDMVRLRAQRLFHEQPERKLALDDIISRSDRRGRRIESRRFRMPWLPIHFTFLQRVIDFFDEMLLPAVPVAVPAAAAAAAPLEVQPAQEREEVKEAEAEVEAQGVEQVQNRVEAVLGDVIARNVRAVVASRLAAVRAMQQPAAVPAPVVPPVLHDNDLGDMDDSVEIEELP